MSVLGSLAVFGLGVYLSIQMIAALYRILDLWYRIEKYYPRVMGGVVGWALVIAVVAGVLKPAGRGAFLAGLASFLVFYLSLFALRHVLIAALRERNHSPGDAAATSSSPRGSPGTRGAAPP